MEQYLIDLGVIEDIHDLKTEDDIIPYVEDMDSSELGIECGQGYYEDEFEITLKVGEKFYKVSGAVDIMSAKQDVGDRLYWVESVIGSSIKFYEIVKPSPPVKKEVEYTLIINESQRENLENFLIENNIQVVARVIRGNY